MIEYLLLGGAMLLLLGGEAEAAEAEAETDPDAEPEATPESQSQSYSTPPLSIKGIANPTDLLEQRKAAVARALSAQSRLNGYYINESAGRYRNDSIHVSPQDLVTDCSGLMNWALDPYLKNLPRGSLNQKAFVAARPVDRETALNTPGMLAFDRNAWGGKPGYEYRHSAMTVGDGKSIIEAQGKKAGIVLASARKSIDVFGDPWPTLVADTSGVVPDAYNTQNDRLVNSDQQYMGHYPQKKTGFIKPRRFR